MAIAAEQERRPSHTDRPSEAAKKRGKHVLEECMTAAMGMAAQWQRAMIEAGADIAKQSAAEARFETWLQMAGTFARALAPFQDPTLKAILMPGIPSEGPRIAPSDDKKNGKVIDDPAALTRLYQQKMRQVVPG